MKKARMKSQLIFTCIFLLVSSHAFSSSFTFEFTDAVNQLRKTELQNTDPNVTTDIASTAGNTENWELEVKPRKMVMIPMDGIIIPIEIEKPSYTAKGENGRVTFQNGDLRSLTRTKAIVVTPPSTTTFNFRPTLFVTLSGLQWDGNGWDKWQDSIQTEVLKISSYQNKHFLVHWDTEFSMREQVADLADEVKKFLSTRKYAWDVVVIGHSRGGIFAHELSKHLVGNAKLNNLHTFLLDPTAATLLGDYYPTSLYNKSPTNHFGSLYYDDSHVLDLSPFPLHFNAAVFSDTNISGYNNYGESGGTNPHYMNTTHAEIPNDWFSSTNQGLSAALNNILSQKQTSTFTLDGDSGLEVVLIDVDKGIYADGDITVVDGNLVFWGELMVEGVNVVNLNGTIGEDGVYAAYSVILVSAAQLVINKDQITVASAIPIAGSTAQLSINDNTLSADVKVLVVSTGADISLDSVSVYVDLGAIQADYSTSDAKNDLKTLVDPTEWSCSKWWC